MYTILYKNIILYIILVLYIKFTVMLNTYYKNLTEENKQFAIHRIASRTDISEASIKRALELKNPLIEIDQNRVVINRNSYSRLLQEARKVI